MTNQEAIIAGTERFLENNKEKVFAAIQNGAKQATESLADSIGFSVGKEVRIWLAKNTPDLVASLKTMMAMDEVVNNIKGRIRHEPAFDIPKKPGDDHA